MTVISNNDIAKAIYFASKGKTAGELPEINSKVVRFLARRRLLSKSPDILERLNKIINQAEEKIIVNVSSVKKLKEELKKELTFFLKERYRAKEIILIETLDEKLLGGIRLEVNDEIIDLTAKNKIKKLQEYLIKKS